MKARILPLASAEHRIAQQLLPWFVNGSLDPAEAAQVRDHLAECSLCQADATTQAQWREGLVDGAPHADVDRGWAALRGRLDLPPVAPARRSTSARAWWRRGFQLAIAAQAVVILVLAIALVAVLSPAEPYRALGSPAVADANAVAVFRPDASQAEMSAALRAAGARIVGGPTATDAYLLRLPDTTAATLARLRAQPGLVSVESLQSESAR